MASFPSGLVGGMISQFQRKIIFQKKFGYLAATLTSQENNFFADIVYKVCADIYSADISDGRAAGMAERHDRGRSL
jgi:hypothetical protein